MGIAERRAALVKKKKRARKLYPHDPKAKLANHLAHCSCHMCGNPRKHFPGSKTLQEMKADNPKEGDR